MAKGSSDKNAENRGQRTVHTVYDANGNPVQMTQAEWRDRDKSLGLRRSEDVVQVPQAPLEEVEGTDDADAGDSEANG